MRGPLRRLEQALSRFLVQIHSPVALRSMPARLIAGRTTALGPSANASLTFGAGSTGKLQLNGNNTTIVNLNTNATVGTPIIESGSATGGTDTLTVNTSNNNTYGGVLQNGGTRLLGLTKSGSGTLTLSGTNTYTGTTAVNNGGTLNVTGSLGNTAVTLNNAKHAFERRFESIGGSVTANAGTFITPGGASCGRNTDLGRSRPEQWIDPQLRFRQQRELRSDPLGANALTLNGATQTLNITGTTFSAGTFSLLTYGSKSAGSITLGTVTGGNSGSFTFSLSTGANATQLIITAAGDQFQHLGRQRRDDRLRQHGRKLERLEMDLRHYGIDRHDHVHERNDPNLRRRNQRDWEHTR